VSVTGIFVSFKKLFDSGGRDGLAPEIWVVGLIGIIVIVLVLFGLVL